MFLLGFRRKLTALALCKSIESAIQWFQIHHRNTFATIQNPAVYLSGARVSIFSTLVPRLLCNIGYLYFVKDHKNKVALLIQVCITVLLLNCLYFKLIKSHVVNILLKIMWKG